LAHAQARGAGISLGTFVVVVAVDPILAVAIEGATALCEAQVFRAHVVVVADQRLAGQTSAVTVARLGSVAQVIVQALVGLVRLVDAAVYRVARIIGAGCAIVAV